MLRTPAVASFVMSIQARWLRVGTRPLTTLRRTNPELQTCVPATVAGTSVLWRLG